MRTDIWSMNDRHDGSRYTSTRDNSKLFHQYGDGNEQYLTRKHHDHGLEVVDLNTRKFWHVQDSHLTHGGWSKVDGFSKMPKNPRLYMGFVKDKFQVFYLDEEIVGKYKTTA